MKKVLAKKVSKLKRKTKKKNGHKKFWRLGLDEYNTAHLDISKSGDLIVREGNYQYNIHDIVKKHGTSAEIFFPTIIENRVRDLIDTFNAYIKVLNYKGKFSYHYPMKVNQNREFVLPVIAEGANIEVSSANELFLVKRMLEQGRFHEKIRVFCNGPKTERYISLIEELKGKGLIITPIIENGAELERLQKFNGPVGIRVDLDMRVKSHWDKAFNRFGFAESELLSLGKIRNLTVLHYHISTQIEHFAGFVEPTKRALEIYAKLKEKNPGLDTLNIGGGAGVPYNKYKKFYTGKSLIQKIVKTAKAHSDALGIKHPNLVVEWGTYVVAPSQMTIFKVLASKKVYNKGGDVWYTVDGSFMNDLTDTWAIKKKWHAVSVSYLTNTRFEKVWFAGSSCDSDDKYTNGGTHILMPRLADCENLYVAFLDTGAYQDSLASHHCLLSSPMKIMVANGEVKVIRKRDTAEDVGKKFGW